MPTRPARPDTEVVALQIGRPPRGDWNVAMRCGLGAPCVIAVGPVLEDGSLFPTAWWLTCPWLAEAVSALESAGECAEWAARVSADVTLAAAVLAADQEYRGARAALADGEDPCAGRGMAGQADPLAVKCLHARVAAALAGNPDPIGMALLAALSVDRPPLCPDAPERECGVRG